MSLIALAERGLLPDALMRWGTRKICGEKISEERQFDRKQAFFDSLAGSPLAIATQDANDQHYEVPAAFYEKVLGDNLKYSCGYWPEDTTSFNESEAAMLKLSCERAGIVDGHTILELGCGWGSLTVWMAEHYPNSTITAVSNSASQREFIEKRLASKGLSNATIITCDMNDFDINGEKADQFDRVISIEMFEHMRNYPLLMSRVNTWLKADGRLFVHIFCHDDLAYPYEDEGEENWMARTFFTGGMMPSYDIFEAFPEHLTVENKWWVNGIHYEKTSNAWLEKMDAQRKSIMPVFEATYGKKDAKIWWNRWRMFFLGVAEFFGYADGKEWGVGHFLLKPNK